MRISDWISDVCSSDLWDGEWYLRAFDDDGRAWGTSEEQECRIDSIAQSWSILSGAGDPERTERAIASARRHLVRDDDNIIRLPDPAFDRTPREPGYIKAYPPGIRENGRSEEHTSELQSLMRISYAVFCLKKKKKNKS